MSKLRWTPWHKVVQLRETLQLGTLPDGTSGRQLTPTPRRPLHARREPPVPAPGAPFEKAAEYLRLCLKFLELLHKES